MDFSNPSLWQLVYLQSFSGDFFGALQLPIPSFDTPSINQQVIRLKISSSTGKPNWFSAGNAAQMVNSGGVDSAAQNYSLVLGQDRLIVTEPYLPYFLRFQLPKYLTQATISIFGYLG